MTWNPNLVEKRMELTNNRRNLRGQIAGVHNEPFGDRVAKSVASVA